jgi:two-component system OmpR family sensor kinase
MAVRPAQEIAAQAEAIGAGTLERRIRAYADSREYQRLVQVLNTMLARLDAAFEAQRRFTGNASHELRSPLTALRGELELARRRERPAAEYQRVIDSALEEVERLSRTTDDLLVLARADAGLMQFERRPIDLAERARDNAARLRTAAAERGITLDVACDDAVPVAGDTGLLDRLIWNLLENAAKFTPPGGRLRLRTERDGGAGVLEVTDSGPGIPAEEAERVFERFYRGDESRTPLRETAGTGLGLSIVRAVADLHGATVTADAAAGGGARFRVRFPAIVNES